MEDLHINGDQDQEKIWEDVDSVDGAEGVDGVGASSSGSLSNGHSSHDSLSRKRRGRNSMSPEIVTFRDNVSPEKEPTKSRLKERIKHLSGLDKEKLDLFPSLSSPITVGEIHDLSEYLRQNSFKTAQIVKILNEQQLSPDEVLDEEEGNCAIHVVCGLDTQNSRFCDALIQTGHSPASQTRKGYTSLHLAILRHHHEILKTLLGTNSDILNQKDINGHTPIHIAVMSQNHEAIKHLKMKNVSFGILNNKNLSPLHMAANVYTKALNEGNDMSIILKIENMVKIIIECLTPQELANNLMVKEVAESPLHIFAKLSNLDAVGQICQKISDPDVFEFTNNFGLTPFMICVGQTSSYLKKEKHNMEYVEMKVEEKRIENKQCRKENMKRRKSSKKEKNSHQLALECAKMLLKKMTDKMVNDTNPDLRNMTALQILLQNVHDKSSEVEKDLVDLLLRKGADVDLTLSDVEAPINIVISQNFNKDILILFIEHLKEENINFQDDNGDTVLHYAVGQNDEESIVKILERKANVMIKNRSEDLQDVDYIAKPNVKAPAHLRPRIPLLIALNHNLNEACNSYFRALRRVGLSRVISNIKNNLLEFFELHIVAAAYISDNQAVRELCKLLTSKSSIQKITMTNRMTENEVVKQVIHFTQRDHFEKTFYKTALAWTNENDDPISASDLLHLEYQSHSSKPEGLSCMKKQLTNDKLLYWMTRTYSKFYPTPNYILWITAIIMSFFQLGFSYFFYTFDIYSDYQLTTDYANAYTDVGNYTLLMLECARVNHTFRGHHTNSSCFEFADKYPETTYKVAFFLTWISMIVSVAVYFIGIVFFFDSKNITEKSNWFHEGNERGKEKLERKTYERQDSIQVDQSSGNCKSYLNSCFKKVVQYFLIFLIKLFWPFFHIYRRVRYEASTNKSKRRNNFMEFESIWIMVKTIEYGIEATIQLIIVLYLLVPYYDEIHNWDFQTTVKKTFFGIAHFVSGGKYKQACLLEKVLGKLAMNVFAQSLSLTSLKYMKYGMSIPEHIFNMIPLFLSYFSQIVARILVLRVFFVTAEELFQIENKGLAIGIFFIIHFSFTLVIKLFFEIRIEDTIGMDFKCFQLLVKFLINWISSSLVYIWSTGYGANPRKHVHEHNTFLPQLFFQLLVLVEHLVLTIFPLTLTNTNCLDEHTFDMTAKLVPCLWIFGNFCLVFHYKSCHTWSQTNGPTQNCLNAKDQSLNVLGEDDLEESSSNDSLCCVQNKQRNQDADDPEPLLFCISNLCCSRKPYKISIGKNCLKFDPETHSYDSAAREKSNGIEMRAPSSPLLPTNNDTSRQELIQ